MNTIHLLVTLVSLASTGATAVRFTVLVCAAQFGASAVMVGLLAAAYAGVGAFASVPAGRFIDRVGTRKPLLLATAILAVGVSLGILWRELPMLFVIVVLSGLAHNTMIIAFQHLAGDLAPPDRRAEAFGMLGLGFSISILAAPVVAGFAIDMAGFAGTFLLLTLIPLCSFAMVWTGLLPRSPAAAIPSANPAGTEPRRSGTLGLLRAPALKRLWVCCAMFESAWMGFNFLLPVLGTQLGFSASRIGLIAGAAGLMLFLMRACLTQLLRRLTPWQLLIIGLLLIGVGFAGFAVADQFVWMTVCGGLIGLGQGAASPMLSALIYENAPAHESGEALALRTLISNASQGSIPLIAGALSSLLGMTPVFFALAACLLGTAWWSRGRWHGQRDHRRGRV